MKLRAPAVPLITVDPYFSIWSMSDKLNESSTKDWTGKDHRITGIAVVDGVEYCFIGQKEGSKKLEQKSLDINALSTKYVFSNNLIELEATFTTPLLMDELSLLSRPVSYIGINVKANDNKAHDVMIKITVDDELCQNFKYEFPTEYEDISANGFSCGKVGSVFQKVLNKSGDDLRINWGHLYLASNTPNSQVKNVVGKNKYGTICNDLEVTFPLNTESQADALVAVAYDDINSLEYFHEPIDAFWKKNGKNIVDVIKLALNDYKEIYARCEKFSNELYNDAKKSGNEKYAELLSLAYRQVIAAHKLALDKNGKVLFVSKECFSNGCAATVDVTYPSIPLFLIYNPELVKGMLRPVFRYASTEEWFYDFAPHDVGQYPILNGQVYSHGTCPHWQMPVEECGNMLICTAAAVVAENDISFAKENWDLLSKWCDYLVSNGVNPDNQLCTDDFAGHLAHNCNLSLKSIMGIASFAILNKMDGNEAKANELMNTAKDMSKQWLEMAANEDGTFRLAFDRPNTFSMKYNAVWDKLFETGIFPESTFKAEIKAYIEKRSNEYGLMLDNRDTYTKSDWLVWSATLSDGNDDFNAITDRLWHAYNVSESRVPMTDWYLTDTAKMVGFQNRTVQGGLFIKILNDKGICKVK